MQTILVTKENTAQRCVCTLCFDCQCWRGFQGWRTNMPNKVPVSAPLALLCLGSLSYQGWDTYLAEKRAAVTGAVQVLAGLALRPSAPPPGQTAGSGGTWGLCTGWCSFWKEARTWSVSAVCDPTEPSGNVQPKLQVVTESICKQEVRGMNQESKGDLWT